MAVSVALFMTCYHLTFNAEKDNKGREGIKTVGCDLQVCQVYDYCTHILMLLYQIYLELQRCASAVEFGHATDGEGDLVWERVYGYYGYGCVCVRITDIVLGSEMYVVNDTGL